MSFVFPTNASQVQAFAGALYGVQVGTATMAQVNNDILANGGLAATLNSYYAATFGSVATATVANTVAANLGLTGAALTSGSAYIAAQLNAAAAGARGAVISNIVNLFGTLTADATFGAAATAWNTKVAAAVTYTGASNVAVGTVVDQSFALTAGSDSLTGTAGNDSFAGVNNAAGTQFTAVDSINGGAGTDTLRLELNASYAGGATITNVEQISITSTVVSNAGTAGGTFNLSGISGLTLVENSASSNDAANGNDVQTFSNIGSASNVGVKNTSGDTTFVYVDSAVAGATDAVTLTLDNVAQANAIAVNLNNTTTLTGTTGIDTLTIALAGAAGGTSGAVTVNTNATASLTKVNVSGAGVGVLTMGTNLTTTATAIDASAASGGVTLAGIGAATHNITMGAGADSVDMGGNLTSADAVRGGAGTDTLASTAANWNTLNTAAAVLANVSEFETLRVTDDAASGVSATINAELVGAVNLRLAGQAQAGGETVTVNNLGGSTGTANVRLDAAVAGVTLNIKDATLPGTANVVNLDVRGTSATNTFTMQGVETVSVNASNAVTATTLAMTNGALTTLTVTNAGAATIDTGTLGANVNSVNLSAVTGGGATTVTLNGTANTGANVTGTAGADTITGSNQLDVISTGAGSDVIVQSLGNDRINVGSGTDDFRMVDLGDNNTAITITAGTTIDAVAEGFDIVTGMGVGDTIRMTAGYDDIDADTTLADGDLQGGLLFNTTFANNSANLVRGNFNASTGLFTISASGADSLFVADVDHTAATADYSGVILVGYVTSATSATLAEVGTTGVVQLTLIA